jgi:hypothetical protein
MMMRVVSPALGLSIVPPLYNLVNPAQNTAMLDKLRWWVIDRLLDVIGVLLPPDKSFRIDFEPHENEMIATIKADYARKAGGSDDAA